MLPRVPIPPTDERIGDLKPGADREAVLDAIRGSVLAKGAVVGNFEKPRMAGLTP